MNLNQITLPSIDLYVSVQFYQKMGFRLIVSSLPTYARFLCPDGDATFSIHNVEQLPTGEGIIIYFECDDLDLTVKELMGKGIAFDELPKEQSWLWREARLKDPDNNTIILYHAGKNRKNPPWRIN